MPDINKIEEIATEVGNVTAINVLPKRCSYVRNWNSKCKLCINACKHDAIKRSVCRLSIDAEACVGCGACVAACPANALTTLAPTQTQIVKEARACAANYDGTAVFACRRDADALQLDIERVTVLPCLNYLDEYLICGLFSVGIDRVALISTDCSGCAMDGPTPYFPVVVESTKALAKYWGLDGKVKVFSECPDNLKGAKRRQRKSNQSDNGRRDALNQARGSVMGYVMESIDGIIDPERVKEQKRKKNAQVKVRPEEKFDIGTYRSGRILNMLDRVGKRPYGQVIESRLWVTIDIDDKKCMRCGCCAGMCATDALHYEQEAAETTRKQAAMPGTLTFTPSMCINCGLCKDACFKKAIIVGNRVPANELDKDVTFALFVDEKPRTKNPYGF